MCIKLHQGTYKLFATYTKKVIKVRVMKFLRRRVSITGPSKLMGRGPSLRVRGGKISSKKGYWSIYLNRKSERLREVRTYGECLTLLLIYSCGGWNGWWKMNRTNWTLTSFQWRQFRFTSHDSFGKFVKPLQTSVGIF